MWITHFIYLKPLRKRMTRLGITHVDKIRENVGISSGVSKGGLSQGINRGFVDNSKCRLIHPFVSLGLAASAPTLIHKNQVNESVYWLWGGKS